MNKLSKIIVTVVIVVVFIALFAVISSVRSDAGAATPGIFGLVVFAAAFASLRAVWKKSDEDKRQE